jgi:hypothetical protein
MRRILTPLLFLLQCNISLAQSCNFGELKNGDILFQDLDCGPLCDAIEQVTQSYRGRYFSHIGLVSIEADSIYVIEAIGTNVKRTPLSSFVHRSKNEILLGRLRPKYKSIVSKAVSHAQAKINIPYDDAFLYNNGKYYCSELIYDAFKEANNGADFFKLAPMTFKIPNTNTFFPVWVSYYRDLSMDIPEGALGINPGGISRDKKLKMYQFKK